MMLHRSPDLSGVEDFFGMVTGSPKMHAFFKRLRRAARSDAPLLIRGETGTGKELVARAAHELSERSHGPFRAINCATLTGELLASELFGQTFEQLQARAQEARLKMQQAMDDFRNAIRALPKPQWGRWRR